MQNEQEIYQKITEVLEDLFEVDRQQVSLESHLYEDLDIDSIDAVDLVVELKKITGKKIRPDDFKSVRTVQDVVDAVVNLLNDG
ncbi:MAG: acyl carrier protein [Gammaproteobacteria bacterium]|nr:acyl carrier protein [Gammaproteobacteria bacterium]